jgi:hypothetical protein
MATILVQLFVESTSASVEEISSLIGVAGDIGWRRGAPRGISGKTYATDAWRLQKKTDVADNADEILSAVEQNLTFILNRMQAHENQFRAVKVSNTSGLLIGISSKIIPPLIVKSEILNRISSLDLDLEIDIAIR